MKIIPPIEYDLDHPENFVTYRAMAAIDWAKVHAQLESGDQMPEPPIQSIG